MDERAKHTPGPWKRDGRTVYALGKTTGGDEVNVFQAGFSSSGPIRATEAEVEANAQLATAAPDMLEALTALADMPNLGDAGYCEICECHAPKNDRGLAGPLRHDKGCPVGRARAAIAKAEGQ